MRIQDFGEFDGPLVLFGGPYSNLAALDAMLAVTGDRPAICTGDIVAYGAHPQGCFVAMRASAIPTIAGNCEVQVAQGADDCGCGFGDGSPCDLLSRGWYAYLSQQATDDMATWMGALPKIGVFTHSGRRYGVIHGGATSINRFIWPTCPDAVFLEEIAFLESMLGPIDGVIAGHSGIAFDRQIDRWHWINAGAIGLPPHDGDPQTRYAILRDSGVEICKLPYDHARAAADMRAAGLVQGYDRAMETGFWPSEDILPEALKRAGG